MVGGKLAGARFYPPYNYSNYSDLATMDLQSQNFPSGLSPFGDTSGSYPIPAYIHIFPVIAFGDYGTNTGRFSG